MSRTWLLLAVPLLLMSCTQEQGSVTPSEEAGDPRAPLAADPVEVGAVGGTAPSLEPLTLSDQAWAARLTAQQYDVLRKEGTERAFTGANWDSKTRGTYRCAGCDLALFSSDAKFRSGTGWPSFFAPIHVRHVQTRDDASWIGVRTEAHCVRCGGHLGHVFTDGPQPTGERWCINGAALALSAGEPTIADRDAP